MTITVTHSKVSAKSDTGDSSIVQPSDWNDDHVVEGSTGGGATIDVDPPSSPGVGDIWVEIVDAGGDGYSQGWAWTGVYWTPIGPRTFTDRTDTSGYQEWLNSDDSAAFYIDNSQDEGGSGQAGFYGPGDGYFGIDAAGIKAWWHNQYGNGIHFRAQSGMLIYSTTADPTTGGGYVAPIGSLLLTDDSPCIPFVKTGSGDTDWTQLATSGSTLTLADVVANGNWLNGQSIYDQPGSPPGGSQFTLASGSPTLSGATGGAAENGGSASIYSGGGDEGATQGAAINLLGGDGSSGHGGGVFVTGGEGTTGGPVGITGGGSTADGGNLTLSGGGGDSDGTPSVGGTITLTGGTEAGDGAINIVGSYINLYSAVVILPNLPTTDPTVAGQLWNNLGVLMVSAG